MNGYFVTGTDTSVGKTLASAIITHAVQGFYWKPVQSGVTTDTPDIEVVRQLTGLPDKHFFPSNYVLQAPLSPNQAAVSENITIDLAKCHLQNPQYPLVVEGAGGIMVPINETHTIIDIAAQCKLPVVIVSRGSLGTLNHSLLTIFALRQRNIPIQGIIFNGELNPVNQSDIEKATGVKTLFHIPRFPELNYDIFQNWMNDNNEKILEALL